MFVTYISVPDMNDSFSRIIILGVEYLIRFTYNDTYDFWSFGIYNPDETPIVQGIKIVPNYPLNLFATVGNMPQVYFSCSSNLEHIGRNAFKEELAKFYYIER